MTSVIRVRDPEDIRGMVPYFTFRENVEENQEKFATHVAGWMTKSPETILVVAAIRDDEIVGFVIATVNPDDPAVWIAQGYSREDNNRRIANEMFMRVVLWTIGLGRRDIRAETSRSIDAFYRRFGFEPVSVIMQYTIPVEVLTKLFESGREVISGKPVQVENRDSELADRESSAAEPTRPASGFLSPAADGAAGARAVEGDLREGSFRSSPQRL